MEDAQKDFLADAVEEKEKEQEQQEQGQGQEMRMMNMIMVVAGTGTRPTLINLETTHHDITEVIVESFRVNLMETR